MDIRLELLKNSIHDIIDSHLLDITINADEITNSTAVLVLAQIQGIIKNDAYSDFEAIEEIVKVFEKYNLDFGNRHDF